MIAVFVPPVAVDVQPYAQALRDAVAGSEKPVVTTFLATEGIPDVLAVRGPDGTPMRGSVPSYPGPERAALALGRAWRYAKWRSRPPSQVVRPAGIDPERARSLVDGWLETTPEGRYLSDTEAALLLSCYGVEVADFRAVTTEEEAVAAAEEIGFPVAVKATGAQWRHRPDLSGVRLDLVDADSVRIAYRDLAAVSGEPLMHVQRMAHKGIGCAIRVQDDPSFGSLISFGLAGVISDLLGDRAYRVLPLTEDEAVELIDAPKAAPLLSGYRNAAPVNKPALVDFVQRISALADDLPRCANWCANRCWPRWWGPNSPTHTCGSGPNRTRSTSGRVVCADGSPGRPPAGKDPERQRSPRTQPGSRGSDTADAPGQLA